VKIAELKYVKMTVTREDSVSTENATVYQDLKENHAIFKLNHIQ
jgi:hypothetical protein